MASQATGGSSQQNSFQQVNEEQVEERPPLGIDYLVQQLRETADKLARDGAPRGDVKLLATALKELRYAFKVFAPYRQLRKITVFGSARLPPSRIAPVAYWQTLAAHSCGGSRGFEVRTPHRIPFSPRHRGTVTPSL